MRFTLLSFFIIGLSAGGTTAQTGPATQGRVLTLAEARQMAEKVSPEIAAARAALRAADGRVRQAGAFPNPVASYSREQTSGDGARNAQDIIALEQRLDIGGQRGARRAAAEAFRAAADARATGTRAQIAFEVARAYAAAVAADRRAALTTEAARIFTEAGRVGRERLAAGDVSGYEKNVCPWYCDTAIGVVEADATQLRVLATGQTSNGTYVSWPAWSPDGARIAFTLSESDSFGYDAVYPVSDILVVSADGGASEVLVMGGGLPSWRP